MRQACKTQFIALVVLTSGCGHVGDRHIDGPYRLVTTDIEEDTIVCYSLKDGCIGRGPEGVFATAFTQMYVVAARHPPGDPSTTEFFYIDRALDGPHVDPSISVKGPFSAAAFATERSRLNLPEPQ